MASFPGSSARCSSPGRLDLPPRDMSSVMSTGLRAACFLLLPASVASAGNWSDHGFPGRIFVRCPDLGNLGQQTVASCEAACDAKLHCNAINIDVTSGACALRACLCGTELAPTGKLSGFSSYRRRDEPCPPAPPPPLFANVFGSGMVLQREPSQARVFGKAPSGAALTVTVAQQGELRYTANVSATANGAGEWACLLPKMPASGDGVSYNLTASLDEAPHHQQCLTEIVWGDVFVCGGQSNMELPLSLVNNHSLELAAATAFPWVRVAVVNSASSDTPLRDTPAPLLLPWQRASPTALGGNNSHSWGYFSATCWLTARNIAEMLGPSVPLGLVGSYVGGTPVESWTPGLNPADKDPEGHQFAVLYNAMIAPLTGMAIRVILFYQGENNSFRGGQPERWIKYATDFPLMIQRWREAWATNTGQSALGDTPFGFVQIGPRDCSPDADHQGSTPGSTFYGGVRWSQTAFQYAVPNEKMPNTFMAVAADLAEGYSPVLDPKAGCVHFGDKQDVGWRLALGVAKHVYGRDLVDTGPMVTPPKNELLDLFG